MMKQEEGEVTNQGHRPCAAYARMITSSPGLRSVLLNLRKQAKETSVDAAFASQHFPKASKVARIL